MSSANHWDAREYLSAFFGSELALLKLRWVYWKSGLGIKIDPDCVADYLNGLWLVPIRRETAV
jgi:hypothetical protein